MSGKKCHESRPADCHLYTQLDSYFICVDSCPENRPRRLREAENAWRCEYPCATRFVGEDGSCLRSCGNALFQTGFATCGTHCPTDAPYAAPDEVFGHRTCVARCPSGYFAEGSGGAITCVSACEPGQLYRPALNGARECVSGCAGDEFETEARFCVKACAPAEFRLGRRCVSACPEKTRAEAGACVSYRPQSIVWAWVVLGVSLGVWAVVSAVILVLLFRRPRAPANEREYEERLRELKAERQM